MAKKGTAPVAPPAAEPEVPATESSELSAYELERLENIRRNEARLAELGLAPGGGLVPTKRPAAAPARAAAKRRRESTPATQLEPQRRSSRIQHVAAPQVFVADEVDEPRQGRGSSARPVTLGGKDAARILAEADADAEDDDALPIEPEQLTPTEREVYEIIREARNAKARSMERSMFIVCGNRTMVEMCRLVPSSPEELLELHGMGELKVQRYGELLLEALRPHAERLHKEHEAMAAARAAAGDVPRSVD